MRFHDCNACGEYKYIAQDGKCQSCLSDDEDPENTPTEATSTSAQSATASVKLCIDIFSNDLRPNTNAWRAIADVIDNEQRVDIVPRRANNAHTDIDIGEDSVSIYRTPISKEYADYSGSQADKLRHALEDALDDAVDHFK